MTTKEYLRQAFRLDQRINMAIAELERLREMTQSVRSPGYEEHFNPNHAKEAPFVSGLEKVWEMEKETTEKVRKLIALKDQIRTTIGDLKNPDERLVLECIYMHGMSWEQISEKMIIDRSTVYRWRKNGLKHVRLPKDPIIL